MHLAQRLGTHMRVSLRRRDRRVTEEFLNGPHVRATLNEMSRIRMAQRMGTHVRNPGRVGGGFHRVERSLPRKTGASMTQEERRRPGASYHEGWARPYPVGLQRLDRIVPKRNHSLFAALATYPHGLYTVG